MAQGEKSKHEKSDDLSVDSSETLWRLIDPDWFEIDTATQKLDTQKLRSAFSGSEISALRPKKLDPDDPIAHVLRVMPGFGIGALSLGAIRTPNDKGHKCIVNTEEEEEWPLEAHVCIYKHPGKPKLSQTQKAALTEALAENIILKPDASKMRPRDERPPTDPSKKSLA
jgi:hypothetical protein